MILNDVVELCKAGFSREEILRMVNAPAPASAPAPAPAPVDPVLLELQKLTGMMQNININNSNQPKVETPEEILAAIINPPMKKE